MRQKITQSLEIPQGITCTYQEGILTVKKGASQIQRKIVLPQLTVKIQGNEIVIECLKGNKVDRTEIMSLIAHIKNMFRGVDKVYSYRMESANVHFPMTYKVEGSKFAVTNFLGEKTVRYATIIPNVKVEVKGTVITITSPDREAAGQTAANIEQATKVRGRDRRIFQDGIYITEKPGRDI